MKKAGEPVFNEAAATQVISQQPASGIILLAAGFSRRFGATKLAARLNDGRSLLQHALAQALETGAPVVLVTREEICHLAGLPDLPHTPQLHTILIDQDTANRGMGHSLQAGVRHIARDWDACLVCLADMPALRSSTLTQLLAALDSEHIVQPVYEDRPGNPIGFGSRFFGQLLACEGDRGARQFLPQHTDSLRLVQVGDPGIHLDVDRPEDLHGLP